MDRRERLGWPRLAWLAILAVGVGTAQARAAEKLILLDEHPDLLGRFKVAPDGSRLYFAGKGFEVFDASGKVVGRIAHPGGAPRDLIPLPDGRFLACHSYARGRLALCRPDGAEEKVLVGKGMKPEQLRTDSTGWTSPTAAAVDPGRRLVFALDTTIAPRDVPDPAWSRIAVFDFDGKFVRDIRRYDAQDPDADDALRTWYDDIALDPARERVYVLARRDGELLALGYDGTPIGRAQAPKGGGLAVYGDGRIAVGGSGRTVAIFDPSLKIVHQFDASATFGEGTIADLEVDAMDRLYAAVRDPGTTFVRWSADLETAEVFGPSFVRYAVDFPTGPIRAGQEVQFKVQVRGRPDPGGRESVRVLIRPSDGSDLRWRDLPTRLRGPILSAMIPDDLSGVYECLVRFDAGPVDASDRSRDPSLQATIAVAPAGATRSVSVLSDTGRTAFQGGESIPLHLVRLGEPEAMVPVRIELEREGKALASTQTRFARPFAVAIPEALTRRLPPGRYRLTAKARDHVSYPFDFTITSAAPDSPMQRILYHEFEQGPTARNNRLADGAERMAAIREHARGVAVLGFNRETDRKVGKLDRRSGPQAWRRDLPPANVRQPGLPPPESLNLPGPGDWETEAYLDEATRFGLRFDTQLLDHCEGVPVRPGEIRDRVPILQRTAQWMGRYPSFRGFNYNDELFFFNGTRWSKDDTAWVETAWKTDFAGRPRADVLRHAIGSLYDQFNDAVRLAWPGAKITTTPMWQFPAVDGSYAPEIYRGMDETYSHYLSEGYHPPWYPAHSAAFLKRPGLPMMGVFDNGHTRSEGGEIYLKNLLQVAAQGVQGVGVNHTLPFQDPLSADAYRVGNALARDFGPVFAEAPPGVEAAVLYSYTQDVTERRSLLGTPHWERVFGVHGAGLMAGIPMEILYEEDLAADRLLEGGRPRVPMLLLVGQTKELPAEVRTAIGRFIDAGGKVFTDADSTPLPGATRLDVKTHEFQQSLAQGHATDAWSPMLQPHFETLAAALHRELARHRRFPIESDDPWVAKTSLDGGAIRYVMAVSETSPYPWKPGDVWSMGASYRKSYLPRTVALSFPDSGSVVYDAFEHRQVDVELREGRAHVSVDLTTFPGRLYAVAPAALGPPTLEAGVAGDQLHFQVTAADESGQPLAARVPIRIRLHAGGQVAAQFVRGTGPDGRFADRLTLPATAPGWTLEVTELIVGHSASASITHRPAIGQPLASRPEVEPLREDRIRELLKRSGGKLLLVSPTGERPTEAQNQALARGPLGRALKARGIAIEAVALPEKPTPGVYLASASVDALLKAGNKAEDLVGRAWRQGQLPFPVTDLIPGRGRGFFTAAFAPRGDGEHAICLVGGDPEGLAKTVNAFVTWLGKEAPAEKPADTRAPELTIRGVPGEAPPPIRLANQTGVRLAAIEVAPDGEHLVVAAEGYQKNLALIADRDKKGELVRAARIGQSPRVDSLHVGGGGSIFAGSNRTTARHGQEFRLIDGRTGREDVFASFGDAGRQRLRFAASEAGDLVLAPGPYGVACWRRTRDQSGWEVAWSRDFWQTFPTLDWPISSNDDRVPQFHAYLPRGADHALILHGEKTNNGWIVPEQTAGASLTAVDLANGTDRWKFDVPIPHALLFPKLHTSPDRTRLLLQVQVGSFNKETYDFFSLKDGLLLGRWKGPGEPSSIALDDATGRIAQAFPGRRLEVRRPDGSLLISRFWPDQPIGLAFLADGKGLVVSDDGGWLTRIDEAGAVAWRTLMPSIARVAGRGERVYAAGWDGRVRAYAADGSLRWTVDCTPAMNVPHPMDLAVSAAEIPSDALHRVERPSSTSAEVPAGENLLRVASLAELKVGGTSGWMSQGKVQIKPADLADGKRTGDGTPWLSPTELFWTATAGRPVWVELAFKRPTDVRALTVFEDPMHPESWPTDAVVQVWDDADARWKTAHRGVFLNGAVNTYPLDLAKVSKLRYAPLGNYYQNFYTTEIEVR